MVLVVLPTGVAHDNTPNMDIVVGSTEDELQIKIIWPCNMTDVTKLLSQFPNTWHGDDINRWQHLAMERAFNQFKEKVMDFVWSKVSIPLLFIVQSKFDFEFVYEHDNGFHMLMILLKNPYSRFGLISSCADQFNSWCSPMLRCLFTCIFHNL